METLENKNNYEETVDLKGIFEAVWSKIMIVIFVAVAFAVIALVYTKLFIPKTYSSSISLYVKNTNTTVESLNSSDLTASQSLANTYISILDEDVVMDSVAQKLMAKYTQEQLEPYFAFELDDAGNVKIATQNIRHKIQYSTVNETELIKVTSYCGNPMIAADMCTFVADIAPDLFVRVIGAGAVEAISEAKVPRVPVAPSARKNCAIAFVLGAAIVVGIITLQYMLDRRITDIDTLKNKVELPLLAEIPFYEIVNKDGISNLSTKKKNPVKEFFKKDGELERNVVATINDVEVPFVVTEAYNTFRNNILFALSTSKKNVVVITSSFSGEGKSTSTANMCISFGETASRVLIIDADLRRPTQHRLFKLKNDVGLSTLLGGMTTIEQSIHKNVHGNLDVMTAGTIPPNPSQMLASEKTMEVIEQLSKMYDYVVVDTSPINVVSDALSLIQNAAGCILVARQNVSQYDELEEAISRVRFANGNILGMIINSVDSDKKAYGYKYRYKYKYNYKYDYSSSQDKAKA